MKSEKGFTLIETLVAVGLLGIIVVGFLGGLTGAYKALITTDEQDIAKTLAQSQMENIMKEDYALSYSAAPIPEVYGYYSAVIGTESFRDSNIQKITVTIKHQDKDVTILEDYKVNR